MSDTESSDRLVVQGRALVRAIEALEAVEPGGSFERAITGLLVAAYRHRLRAIVGAAPAWVGEEILSASEHLGEQRPVRWTSED